MAGPARARRLPFEPLERTLRRCVRAENEAVHARSNLKDPEGDSTAPGVAEYAIYLGVERTKVYRWRDQGVTSVDADRIAVSLGLWPQAIWGPSFDDDLIDTHEGTT